MNLRIGILILATFIGATALVYYSKPISEWIVSFVAPQIQSQRPYVGKLDNLKGSVFIRSAGHFRYSEAELNEDGFTELLHQDLIKIERSGEAQLKIDSGYSLFLRGEALASIEYFNPQEKKTSPVYLTIQRGDFFLVEEGVPGTLYIIKDKRIFAPTAQEHLRTSTGHTLEADTIYESQSSEPEPQPLSEAEAPRQVPIKLPEKLPTGAEKTLTNEYIEEVFQSRINDFRRCQINSFRDGQETNVFYIFSVTIAPSGQAQKVHTLQSSKTNEMLESCVISVIERLEFQPFEGLPITLSYPLSFE